MRKLVVLLAVMAGVIFTIGAAAPVANAGNCTNVYDSATTYYSGLLHFGVVVGSCSGVAAVQWGSVQDTTYPNVGGYWYDGSEGGRIHYAATHYNNLTQATPNGGWEQVIYNITPWCGGADHWISTGAAIRIESIDPKGGLSWGGWHPVVTGGYPITC